MTPLIYGTVSDVNSLNGTNGVTMNGLPGDPVTDANGDYSAAVEYGWSGTVRQKKKAMYSVQLKKHTAM